MILKNCEIRYPLSIKLKLDGKFFDVFFFKRDFVIKMLVLDLIIIIYFAFM